MLTNLAPSSVIVKISIDLHSCDLGGEIPFCVTSVFGDFLGNHNAPRHHQFLDCCGIAGMSSLTPVKYA